MRIDVVSLALALCVATAPLLAQAPAGEDGAALERRVHVQFAVAPADWKFEQLVMDTIWQPLGLHGVNHYAYGRAVPPHKYAARSDPSSSLYQAWFGAYTVVGDSAFRLAAGKNYAIESVRKLAEYDQVSWLTAMGDPHPLATSDTVVTMQPIEIDGVQRTLCIFHMYTHSDLSAGATPLAQYMGMPDEHARLKLSSFHNISLHVYYVFWYDKKRDATIVVYAASSSYVRPSIVISRSTTFESDNGMTLDKQFHEMIRGVHIVDATPDR